MQKPPRLLRTLLWLLILLPLSFQLVGMVALFIATSMGNGQSVFGEIVAGIIAFAALVFIIYFCFIEGRRVVRKSYALAEPQTDSTPTTAPILSRNFFVRYLGVVIACAYTVMVALVAIFLPAGTNRGIFEAFITVFGFAHAPSDFLLMIGLLFATPKPWPLFIPPAAIYAIYMAGMAWEFRVSKAPRTNWRGGAIFAATLVVCSAVFVWRAEELKEGIISINAPTVGQSEDWTYRERYLPYPANKELTVVAGPTLTISNAHPRLDGATALIPIYSSAAVAIYKNIESTNFPKIVRVSTTPEAYAGLLSGESDMIFAAQPSPEQIAAAKAKGLEFQLTPIGREAFVFFVNEANPVENLTTAQIRDIYKRRITDWSEVGGHREKILPFQRPKNSGSQTAMELQVMRGETMATPLREESMRGMGGIVLATAEYRNAANAIGYSFRFFVTSMTGTKGIKLLKIDGVAPTVETIRNGTYPYGGKFYAITTNQTATRPHVQELIAWFQSKQGKKLIEATGYVPLSGQ